MIRGWLVHWLLWSRTLCWVGLHMPVYGVAFTEKNELIEDVLPHCAVCQKFLRRR